MQKYQRFDILFAIILYVKATCIQDYFKSFKIIFKYLNRYSKKHCSWWSI